MVAMAGLQVFIVRFFFQGARKGTEDPSSSGSNLLHGVHQLIDKQATCKCIEFKGRTSSHNHIFQCRLIRRAIDFHNEKWQSKNNSYFTQCGFVRCNTIHA